MVPRIKFRYLSMPTNYSDCLKRDSYSKHYFQDIMSQEPQLWASSIRGEASLNQLYEDQVKAPVQNDTTATSEGFGCSPPAAPVTILTRNIKGVWTKFKDTAGNEDVLVTPRLGLQTKTHTEPSDAATALYHSRRFVQLLLRELIASLPLHVLDTDDVKKLEADGPLKRNRHTPSTRSLSSPPSRRSLCVQTHTFNESSCCEAKPLKQRAKAADEKSWAGGVRALRDAHVRLVLRQLRHVERLNRALDRRARDCRV